MPDVDLRSSRDSIGALVSCPLKKGVAARMTQFVYDLGVDIIEHRQYVDSDNNKLFVRLEWKADPPDILTKVVKTISAISWRSPLRCNGACIFLLIR